MSTTEPKPIFRTGRMVEADLLKSYLEDKQIVVVHQSDIATGFFATRGVGRTIAVPPDQVDEALELIADYYETTVDQLEGKINPDDPEEFAFSNMPIPFKVPRPLAIAVLILLVLLTLYTIWAFVKATG